MAASTDYKDAILDCIGSTGTAVEDDATIGTGTHISLHTGDPGATGASEVDGTGNSYARIQVNRDGVTSPYWNAAASNVLDNNGAITFAQDGGDAVVTHWGCYDASTAGNFLFGGSIGSSFTYDANTIPEFADGALDVSIG